MQKKWIYLDHAATTPVRPEAVEAMLPFLYSCYGNPSSAYSFSEGPRRAIADARAAAAALIGARADEIYFTNGGTESDNWALTAAAEVYGSDGAAGRPFPHIITTRIEHPAVLRTCEYLERRGFSVTYLGVDAEGFVSPSEVEAAISPRTALISVMMANNEIGTIEPVSEIGEIAHRHGILFHTDAVQAVGHIPIDVNEMNIDLLSASGHKFGGPKGAGFLYIRKGVPFQAFLRGGGQERGRRAGTENVPGIVGMGKAAELAAAELSSSELSPSELAASGRPASQRSFSKLTVPITADSAKNTPEAAEAVTAETASGTVNSILDRTVNSRVRFLRDHLVRRILMEIPGTHLNGPAVSDSSAVKPAEADKICAVAEIDETAFILRRLPGNANVTFDGVSAESLLIALDMKGVCVSAGSACSSGALDPSHVLTAIGLEPEAAGSTIRMTVGAENTLQEIDEAVEIIAQAVERIRSLAEPE